MKVGLNWFGASLDFGYRAPGCLQVWGVDAASRSYRVAEVYFTMKDLDWWAERTCELWTKYKFVVGVADCAEPRSIDHLNDRLGPIMGRGAPRIFRPADKSLGKLHGLNMVRWALTPDEHGDPRVFLVEDAFPYGWDQELKAAAKPTCTEQEIPSYVFPTTEGVTNPEVREKDERPDPRCADHGCHALEYWLTYLWRKDHTPEKPPFKFPKGSIGEEYEMDKIWRGETPSYMQSRGARRRRPR